MANYPAANGGDSQAYTCVAWKDGKAQETLIAKAGEEEEEEVLLVRFNVDDIRVFRNAESWRMDYRRRGQLLQMVGINSVERRQLVSQ